MGRIYETMRSLNDGDNKVINGEEYLKYISFYEFITILALYSDDSEKIIAEYLISNEEFLKLDFYILSEIAVDKDGNELNYETFPEINIEQNNSGIDYEFTHREVDYSLLSEYSYIKINFIHHTYDAFKDDDPRQYPTKEFLYELLEEHTDNVYDDMYWKIEDLVDLKSMKKIGFNKDAMNVCINALYTNPNQALKYEEEKKELLNQSETIKRLKEENTKLKEKLKDEQNRPAQIVQNDKELTYKSEMAVAKLLYTLLAEHKYDLSTTKGKTNDLIVQASELHGTSVTRNFVAKWIELANQVKNDNTY